MRTSGTVGVRIQGYGEVRQEPSWTMVFTLLAVVRVGSRWTYALE